MKSLRQDADDLPGLAVHDDIAAHDGSIAAKFAVPIAVSEHGGFGSARRIILFGEATGQDGKSAEERESGVRDSQGMNLVGLRQGGHAHRGAPRKNEILEG